MEEQYEYIMVFTPYHPYHHLSFYCYDKSVYGNLSVGTAISTTMGYGIIVKKNIPEDKLPNIDIYDIGGLASEKITKQIKKEWWDTVLTIHNFLQEQQK